jgi:hypothetical protein
MYVEFTKAKGGNNASGNGVCSCKYYEDFDQWWHQSTAVTKHVSASAQDTEVGSGNDEAEMVPQVSSLKLGTPSSKAKFHDQALMLFSKMVDNSTGMMESFKNINVVLQNVDSHMANLIDKL